MTTLLASGDDQDYISLSWVVISFNVPLRLQLYSYGSKTEKQRDVISKIRELILDFNSGTRYKALHVETK